jgi:hypothetical protein
VLKQLLILEKKTLGRGFLVSVICIFPFTFLPVVLSSHNSFSDFVNRVPQSLLYTVLFAALVLIAAVGSNYQKLQAKEKLFWKAAFRSLGFEMHLEGVNSIVQELSPFLTGCYGNVFYKIDLDIDYDDSRKFRVRLLPLLTAGLRKNKALAKNLRKVYPLEPLEDLCIVLSPREDELDHPAYLSKHLTVINSEIQRLLPASEPA